ncbi:MAG TPA: tyrosine-protein phosphatase [Kribbella sp.]|nr:tyrosine-protein phosphatase [Kribbella sp.]
MRKLDWPNCSNARDLAGHPTPTGEVLPNRLIRSDNLGQLVAEGLAAVEAAGITRFVDLRSAWECTTFPSPYATDPRWHNVPLWDPADEDVSGFDLYEQYRVLVDDHAGRVGSAVAAIAEAPPGCVVVNCHAGKDRTGVVIALTLDVLGVPPDQIAADYGAPSEIILRLLAHVRQRHGGAYEYLLQAGVTDGQVGDLRSRLTG